MRGGDKDPRANAMKKLKEAINGFKNVLSLNPDQDSDGEQGLPDQLDQAQNQLQEILDRNQLLSLVNQLSDLHNQVDAMESSLLQHAGNQETGELALAEPDIRRQGLGVANPNRDGEAFNAFRQLLATFLSNIESEGGRGAVGRAAGGDGGAGAGAGDGGAGGAGDGGAGAVVEDGDLEPLIARVTEVLTRRTEDFRRMQAELNQARAAQVEARNAEAHRDADLADALSITEGFATATEAALTQATEAAQAAQAKARAEADAALARVNEAERAQAKVARDEAEKSREIIASARLESALVSVRLESARDEAQAAQAALVLASQAVQVAEFSENSARAEAQRAEAALAAERDAARAAANAAQADAEKRAAEERLAAERDAALAAERDAAVQAAQAAAERARAEAQAAQAALAAAEARALAAEAALAAEKAKPSGPAPAPAPAPPPPPPPPPGPGDPPAPDPEPPKKLVVISEDEKRRNGLYLRQNFYETAIPESKKEEGSNVFFVITDKVGDGSRKIDESRRYDSYTLSNQAYFFRALNNDVDFFSGNGVRICFMKSRTNIKVGECDITEQSFIDINDEIAKTRIFIDENGRKKIEDYRLLLEEEFKTFLEKNFDKKIAASLCAEVRENYKDGFKGLSDVKSVSLLPSYTGASGGKNILTQLNFASDDKIAACASDDGKKQEFIEKKAKELADDTLANRFKSGIIGVEVEKTGVGAAAAGTPAPAAGAPAPAPAPAKEYEDVAIGFIKIVRSKKPDEPVRVFVGETAGPTTANIWDRDTKSYVQIKLETKEIEVGGVKKMVIDGIEKIEQISQNDEKITPSTSKLKIDLFMEKTGDRSGLFPDPAPGQDEGSELQMLQKIEIRGGNKVGGGGGYYLTNGFAHQKEGEPSDDNSVLFVGKIKTTDTNQTQDQEKKIEFLKTDKKIKIKIENGSDLSKCKEKLISEFMEKAIPEYKTPNDQSKHVQGIVLRHQGQMNISEIGVSKDNDKFLKCIPVAPPENPTGNVRITQTTFSKTSSPAPSPNHPSVGPAQQSSSCFPFR